jgi:hypothetical protein
LLSLLKRINVQEQAVNSVNAHETNQSPFGNYLIKPDQNEETRIANKAAEYSSYREIKGGELKGWSTKKARNSIRITG